jgi:hypothetical protein
MMDRDTPLFKPTRRGSFGIKSQQRGQQEATGPASVSKSTSSKQTVRSISTTSHDLLNYLDTKYGVSADEDDLQQQQDRWCNAHYEQPLSYDSDEDESSSSCSSRNSSSTISTNKTPRYLSAMQQGAMEDTDVEQDSYSASRSRSRTRRHMERCQSNCSSLGQTPRHQSFSQARYRSTSKLPRRCHSVGVPNRFQRQQLLPTIEEFQPQKVELSIRSLPSSRTLQNVIDQRCRQHQRVASHTTNGYVQKDVQSLLIWDHDALQSCRDDNEQLSNQCSKSRRGTDSPSHLPPPPPPTSKSRSPKDKDSPRSTCSISTTSSMMSPPKMPCRRASPPQVAKKNLAVHSN